MRPSMHAALAATFVLAAAMQPQTVYAGKAENILNAAFAQEPEALDAYKIAGREGANLARHIFDGLLYKDPETNEFKPALAKSWRVVDPKTMEFELREHVVFHDGAKFDADDVVETLNTVRDPKYGTRYQVMVDWIGDVEKLGPYKVRIKLVGPVARALEMLADWLPIYPHRVFKEKGSSGMAANPIGTGPYRLIEMTPGVRYVLSRFDKHYAGSPKGGATIDKIVVRTIPELNTQFAELMSGKLDWVWRIPPDQAKRLQQRVQIINRPIMRVAYVGFAVGGKSAASPVQDIRVRQAINHAVNREAIVKAFVGGSSEPLKAACNPLQFGCEQNVRAYEYSPAKAKALLAEAGFANGFDLDLTFSGLPRPVAEAIASDLDKVGVRVRLNEQQFAPSIQKWRAGELPIWITNIGSYGIGDVMFIVSTYFGGGDDDLVKDKDLVNWLSTADNSPDNNVRRDFYSKAFNKIADQAYWLPLYNFNVNYGLSKDLTFTPYPDEFPRWWASSWK